ncbi:General vesicular transport factor p115 [Frankliniella fusca]|uniref:General vesicular transport factor p115 n=1 Tax=Frankliniella fusca TaxID=407009 RepID=A0AAE1LFY0_9NEOP|nr:General vesicular transport factor p115 [Frankliniella fusca]
MNMMTAIFNEGRRTAPSAAADNDKCMAVAFQGEDEGNFGLAFQSWIADEVNHDQICEGRDINIFWPEEFQCYQAPVARTANSKFQNATWTRITVTVRKLGEYKSMVDKCKVLTDTKGVSSELDAAARRLASRKKYVDMVDHQTIKKRSCDEGSKGGKKKRRKHGEAARAKKGNIPSSQLVDSILASEPQDTADFVEVGVSDSEDESIPNTVTTGQAADGINSMSRTDLIELCERLLDKNKELTQDLEQARLLLKASKVLPGLNEQLEAIQRHVRDAEVASSNLVARQQSSSDVSGKPQKQFLKLVEKENVDPSVKQTQLGINPALGHHSPKCYKEPHQTTYYSVSAGGITQEVVQPTYFLVEGSSGLPALSSPDAIYYNDGDDSNIISMALPLTKPSSNYEMAKEQQDNTAISTTIPLQSAECLPQPPQQNGPVVEHDDSQVVRVPKEAPTLEFMPTSSWKTFNSQQTSGTFLSDEDMGSKHNFTTALQKFHFSISNFSHIALYELLHLSKLNFDI